MPRHSMAKQSMFFFPFDEIRNMYPTIQLREIINFQLKCALRIQHNLIVFKLNFVFLDSSFSCFSSSFLIGWFHGALSISKWLKVDFEFGTLNGPQFFFFYVRNKYAFVQNIRSFPMCRIQSCWWAHTPYRWWWWLLFFFNLSWAMRSVYSVQCVVSTYSQQRNFMIKWKVSELFFFFFVPRQFANICISLRCNLSKIDDLLPSLLMSQMITREFNLAKFRANCAPTPPLPPVMRTTWPETS